MLNSYVFIQLLQFCVAPPLQLCIPINMYMLKRVGHGLVEKGRNYLKPAEAESNANRQKKECREMIQLIGAERFRFNHGVGSMEIEVNTPEELDVCVTADDDDSFESMSHQVSHLPPVTLSFQHGAMYPSSAPPYVQLSCVWLADRELKQLENELKTLWRPDELVLRDMCTYVHENTLSMFHNGNLLLLDRDHFSEQGHFLECNEILQMILDFNAEKARPTAGKSGYFSAALADPIMARYNVCSMKNLSNFVMPHLGNSLPTFQSMMARRSRSATSSSANRSMTECKVCMDMTAHFECIFLPGCGHAFCDDCVSSLLKHNIQEGTLKDCKCPETDCGQKIQPALVKTIVDEELYARYERLLLDSCLGTMNDVVYCPLLDCQAAMVVDKSETQGMCVSCSHEFCLKCMKPAHEEDEDCGQVEDEYLAADEGGRKELEAIYGKEKFRGVLDTTKNDVWLQGNTRACPECSAAIQKDGGCSKMVCSQCRLNFCWQCMQPLGDLADPYTHYWKKGTPCYQKLFADGHDGNYDYQVEHE